MDIDLGEGIDGVETAELILERHDIPVIFLSSRIDDNVVKRTLKITSYGYVPKDGGDSVLLASINMAFRLYDALIEQKKTEQYYRTLFENTGSGIIMIEADKTIDLANEEFARLVGYSREEIEGKIKWPFFVYEEDIDRMVQQHRLRREKPDAAETSYEFRLKTKSGELKDIVINISMIPGTEKSIASLFEITERKKAEQENKILQERLFQAHKMEAIGTLAGGIAHNFNNILMGISGYTSLVMANTAPASPEHDYLKGIEECVNDATGLTKNLLGFARGGKYEVKPTDIHQLIDREIDLFSKTRKDIVFLKKYTATNSSVKADQGQMRQAFLNLFINAWQAMPDGGNIYVETKNETLTKTEIEIETLKIDPGLYVEILITDTGAGMDKATREKIFTPFFTTKDVEKASGLGLASTYGIIKNHNGLIDVHSEKGKGTTFTILLPASDSEPYRERDEANDVLPIPGEGTILLVDDEKLILDIGVKLLRNLGFNTITASGGIEAVEKYKNNRDKISLVILDMTMPGMGGSETFDRLKELDPEVVVLLASGYSEDERARDILKRGCNGFIQKPFSLNDLSIKINEILKNSINS